MMRTIVLAFIVLLVSRAGMAEDACIASCFIRKGVDGTLVLSSLKGARTIVHHDERANRRFPVASTFKILNTLVALEEKAVTGKEHVFRWDGKRHDIADWNRDQTLESAFRVSCVWYYQEIARKVGAATYRSYLKRTGFGKLREPFEADTFWLDGSLEISASEQADFLRKLYLRKLPFSDFSYETLREIMVAEKKPDFTIYGKTGWAASATPPVGWYVGYIETDDEVWFFALNMDVLGEADLPLRKQLVREALQAKGIIR
ncbi:MAG: class D beta-lactamase [Chlorobi bacterium]|nr:class D beta-lactamase [Chlorobiota bacterium]